MQNYGFVKVFLLSCLMMLATPLYVDDIVNMRTATVKALVGGLTGVDLTEARATIVGYRKKHSAYLSIEELKQVKRVDACLLKKNRQVIPQTDIRK